MSSGCCEISFNSCTPILPNPIIKVWRRLLSRKQIRRMGGRPSWHASSSGIASLQLQDREIGHQELLSAVKLNSCWFNRVQGLDCWWHASRTRNRLTWGRPRPEFCSLGQCDIARERVAQLRLPQLVNLLPKHEGTFNAG